jgi:hypothetical protein
VPRTPVILAASVGALLLMVVWTPLLFWWNTPHPDMTATGMNVVGALYMPLIAWGPSSLRSPSPTPCDDVRQLRRIGCITEATVLAWFADDLERVSYKYRSASVAL